MHVILRFFLKTKVLASTVKAKQLYEYINESVNNNENITLDFSGISGATLNFFTIIFNNINYNKNSVKFTITNIPISVRDQISFLIKNHKEIGELFEKNTFVFE